MVEFNDRRPHIPKPDDYERPLDRQALIEANRRYRRTGTFTEATMGLDPKRTANDRITKARGTRRVAEGMSVGDYLDLLAGTSGRGWGD